MASSSDDIGACNIKKYYEQEACCGLRHLATKQTAFLKGSKLCPWKEWKTARLILYMFAPKHKDLSFAARAEHQSHQTLMILDALDQALV